MSSPYDDHDFEYDEPQPPPKKTTYEVFNPENTVGVACDRDGEVVGLHITDDARESGDSWLSSEIVKLAMLAHMQSRLGLRKEMEVKGTRSYTIDSFGLPTEAGYRAMEQEAFGPRAH
ncbi:hypothetical protein [Nocardia flavorosea]|uniref:hypothetical protein n=1 Tax=Nocardia flavorosea TaxID=53429 RepID=UPI0007A54634|nr:hypothetical protein [Nocardia flavorosea]